MNKKMLLPLLIFGLGTLNLEADTAPNSAIQNQPKNTTSTDSRSSIKTSHQKKAVHHKKKKVHKLDIAQNAQNSPNVPAPVLIYTIHYYQNDSEIYHTKAVVQLGEHLPLKDDTVAKDIPCHSLGSPLKQNTLENKNNGTQGEIYASAIDSQNLVHTQYFFQHLEQLHWKHYEDGKCSLDKSETIGMFKEESINLPLDQETLLYDENNIQLSMKVELAKSF